MFPGNGHDMGNIWATFCARISEADDWLAALISKPDYNAAIKTDSQQARNPGNIAPLLNKPAIQERDNKDSKQS